MERWPLALPNGRRVVASVIETREIHPDESDHGGAQVCGTASAQIWHGGAHLLQAQEGYALWYQSGSTAGDALPSLTAARTTALGGGQRGKGSLRQPRIGLDNL